MDLPPGLQAGGQAALYGEQSKSYTEPVFDVYGANMTHTAPNGWANRTSSQLSNTPAETVEPKLD